jgi:plastocyanin
MSAHSTTYTARTTNRVAGVLAVLLMALSAVLFASAPAEAASHAVTIKQYAYGPGSMNIEQGDTVTWTNQDTASHDVVVTSGPVSFRSPMLDKGESWSYTFTTAGAYSYTCSVHPDMRGSVTAVAPAPAPATSAPVHEHTEAAAPSATPPPAGNAPATSGLSAAPKPGRKPHATPVPSQVAAPATTQLSTAAQEPTTTLDPLLLVAGVSIAVVVFCLLLMVSRPSVASATPEPEEDGPA